MKMVLDVGTTANLLSLATFQEFNGAPVDSAVIGTSVLHNVVFSGMQGGFGQGIVGLVGTPILSQYDLVFDGPHHVVDIYAQPKSPDVGSPAWFPAGVTPGDCMPMTADPQFNNRIFFPLEVNGHDIHSMFDSGSGTTNMNMAAAKLLGLGPDDTRMHLLPQGIGGQFSRFAGQNVWRDAWVTITVGHQKIVTPANIYQDLPRETSPDDPELSLGLEALNNRVLYVSYSTQTVCMGAAQHVPPAAPAADAAQDAPVSAQQLASYVAVKKALVPFWQDATNRPLLQQAQQGFQSHLVTLDDYKLTTGAFDYPTLVKQDTALADIFAENHLAPTDFEPVQVSMYAAAATLAYDQAMRRSLPPASTALGKNVELASHHLLDLAEAGIALPRPAADAGKLTALSAQQLERYISVKKALAAFFQSPAHAGLVAAATALGHRDAIKTGDGVLKITVFDYPLLSSQDAALAAVFRAGHFAPDKFEPTQVAVYQALGTLANAEAEGAALPDTSSVLGRNIALVKAHQAELAAVGVKVGTSAGSSMGGMGG
ncbi:MAG: pepsin/retropepsin-like aspartic protease family protein [Gemmatimonadaceae bacterium]